ncbi:hypothetical protein [Candidatus Methylopumilus planktonicus]|uniref:hypothetical protein n=1 Tax=Candidatus Methylopumilus planktonicus TaxID=1581557 RepID=UPI003BEF28DB
MPKDHLHPNLVKTKHLSLLSLFSSGGTLICCALPALLVSLGAGAVMASLVSSVPQIVWFSEHKLVVFTFAGMMLSISGFLQWKARSLPCPSDKELAELCNKTRVNSLRVYFFSVCVFLIGGFMAFVAPWLIS